MVTTEFVASLKSHTNIMDNEIRRNDPFKTLVARTRAGLFTVITDLEIIRLIRETGFQPLARYRVYVRDYYIRKDYHGIRHHGKKRCWHTSKCNHCHHTKKAAKNCLNRSLDEYWRRMLHQVSAL